jgi:hypothetical protein
MRQRRLGHLLLGEGLPRNVDDTLLLQRGVNRLLRNRVKGQARSGYIQAMLPIEVQVIEVVASR